MRTRIVALLAFVTATLLAAVLAVDPVLGQDNDEPAVAELVIAEHHGKLLRTEADIYRTQVADESICRLIHITPRELSIVGRQAGVTDVTVWLRDGRHRPLPLRVRVVAE